MSYCQYKNAFQDNNKELDEMAYYINKKKSHKKNKNNLNNYVKSINNGIEYLTDKSRFVPQHFNQQDDASIESSDCVIKNGLFDMNQLNNDDNSDTAVIKDFSLTQTDMTSNYSSLPMKYKKQFKSSNEHLAKYNDNDKDILEHLSHCSDCTNKLEKLMKHISSDKTEHLTNQNNIFSIGEMKDLIILILVGVFIIIVISMFIRR